MPLYEYECKKCHHRFEKIQSFAAKHTKKCPKCGGPVEQVISAPAVQFKGSGWYVTDYAKNKPSSGSSSSNSNGDSSSESSSKGDSKDDSKSADEKSRKSEEKSKSDEKSKSEEKPKSESKSEKKKAEKK
jgi:putative FmdB family regulatory protein